MFCTVGDDDLFVTPKIVRVTMVPRADVGIGPYVAYDDRLFDKLKFGDEFAFRFTLEDGYPEQASHKGPQGSVTTTRSGREGEPGEGGFDPGRRGTINRNLYNRSFLFYSTKKHLFFPVFCGIID